MQAVGLNLNSLLLFQKPITINREDKIEKEVKQISVRKDFYSSSSIPDLCEDAPF